MDDTWNLSQRELEALASIIYMGDLNYEPSPSPPPPQMPNNKDKFEIVGDIYDYEELPIETPNKPKDKKENEPIKH